MTTRSKLLILLGISATARIIQNQLTLLISRDSVDYIALSRHFARGEYKDLLAHDYHPLYQILTGLVGMVAGDFETAGYIVSIVMGTLAVIPLYYLGRNIFGETAGLVSAVLFVFHPYMVRFSADVLSDPTYLCFFLSAVWFGYSGLEGRGTRWFILAGAFSGLAYLTRPEGIGTLGLVGLWIIGGSILNLRQNWWRMIGKGMTLLVAFLIFAMPYIFYLHEETGRWILTKKKSVGVLIGIDELQSPEPAPPGQPSSMLAPDDEKRSFPGLFSSALAAAPGDDQGKKSDGLASYINSCLKVLNKFAETVHPLLFPLFLLSLGWRVRKRETQKGDFYLLSHIIFYYFVLCLLVITYAYTVSRRHLVPLNALVLLWSGDGLVLTARWVSARAASTWKERWRWLSKETLIICLCLMILIMLPKTFKVLRKDKLGVKEAGEWIQSQGIESPVEISDFTRIGYYAGGKHINLPALPPDQQMDVIERSGAHFLGLPFPESEESRGGLLELLRQRGYPLVFSCSRGEGRGNQTIGLFRIHSSH